MKPTLLCIFILFAASSFAQTSDFFIVKKKYRTVKTFFKGGFIDFKTVQGEKFNGYIKKIQNDSVWVEYHHITRSVTHIGSVILDTFVYNAKPFAVKDIAMITKDDQPSRLLPTMMQAGAIGYTGLHVFNGLRDGGEIEGKNIAIAAGVYVAGTVWKRFIKSEWVMGKRYRVQYVAM